MDDSTVVKPYFSLLEEELFGTEVTTYLDEASGDAYIPLVRSKLDCEEVIEGDTETYLEDELSKQDSVAESVVEEIPEKKTLSEPIVLTNSDSCNGIEKATVRDDCDSKKTTVSKTTSEQEKVPETTHLNGTAQTTDDAKLPLPGSNEPPCPAPVTPAAPTQKKFQCERCEYRTNFRYHLKMHEKTHTGVKDFKCTLCDYGTNRKYSLKIHMKSHTGEKRFLCKSCDYGTNSRKRLTTHVKIHEK